MSNTENMDKSKRNAIGLTATLGAVGGVATAIPFVSTFTPSEKARAAGAPVEVDVSELKPGELLRVEWQGKPVWVLRRTKEMIDSLAGLDEKLLDATSDKFWQLPIPDYVKNESRSIKPEYLVVVGLCSHLGCSPSNKFEPGAQPSLPSDWTGGFLCPCHGSTFDLAGRVFKNKPANKNLDVPPHMYLSDTVLVIGKDENTA